MGINQAYHRDGLSLPPICTGTPTVGQQVGGTQKPSPTDQFPVNGTLTAIDVNTGRIAWQDKPSCRCMAASWPPPAT